jgi:hypothetical protein
MTLVPSHVAPLGHGSQNNRVVGPPPCVYCKALHVLHKSCPVRGWYLLPAPQSEHVPAPAALYLPAGHDWATLLPSHCEPAGQRAHSVRVEDEPPLVWDPAGHVEHVGALAALYFESLPHGLGALFPSQE